MYSSPLAQSDVGSQTSTAAGRSRGKRSGVITQETLTGVCVCKRDSQTGGVWKHKLEQDEAGDTLLSTCGDEDGEAGRGEQTEGRDEGRHGKTGIWRREVCPHLSGGDGELLQMCPVLPTAA